MTFKYARYSPNILRPVIPLAIHHGSEVVDYEVLIDSGADISIFACQVGEYLGFDVPAGRVATMTGVTGDPQDFYIHTVRVELGGHGFGMEVGFVESMNDRPYGIVGQYGFFELFKVTFDIRNEEVQLEQYDR